MDFKDNIEGFSDGEEPLHFYYNREERISRAPKIVQDYYSGKMNMNRKGLFKTMFANRGNRFLFAGIIIFMAFIWIYSLILNRNSCLIAGTSVNLSAFSYEESIYASLKLQELKEIKNQPIKSTISVTFSFLDKDNLPVDEKKVVAVFDGTEQFVRTKCEDCGIVKVVAVVSWNDEEKILSTAIEHH